MLYTKRRVKKLIRRLQQEYGAALDEKQREMLLLKEENRMLEARVLKLEEERGSVADALIFASKASEKFSEEQQRSRENEERERKLLAEKCRDLSERLQEKYPDREDVAEFARYTEQLRTMLGEEEEEDTGFNMDDVIAPKQPLDLAKLCRDLGLMEENS